MEIKDLFVTPVVIVFIFAAAYFLKPFVTQPENQRYFFPALLVKIVGAISLGLIYQFYYDGGDTYNYFSHGSRYIWEAFRDQPILALKLIFAGTEYSGDTFQYASKIYMYGDSSSYFVVRIAGVLDIITFHTYSATAVLFAALSFSGLWAMYYVFNKMYPKAKLGLAIAVLFIPSVFFWGSGILKDTITIGALGWATFSIYKIFIERRKLVVSIILLLISFYAIYAIKIYILLCFLPAAILWIIHSRLGKFRNIALRIVLAPLIIAITLSVGYYTINVVGEESPRYNIDNITQTAKVTAEWIHYVSELEGGSTYNLGDFDYSLLGISRKLIPAIWVTLYRPHFWEVNNVVMLFSAFESFILLLFSLYVIYKVGIIRMLNIILTNPFLQFCFLFSIVFAFAVGLTTYNFGSLVRYKIPMYPFFVSGLFILLGYAKSDKNRSELDSVE